MDAREGLILWLRLQGLGFHPEDAAVLVELWKTGGSAEALMAAAAELGYGPEPALEAALADIMTREADDGS